MRLLLLLFILLLTFNSFSQKQKAGIYAIIDTSKKSNSVKDLPYNYVRDMMIQERAKKNSSLTVCDRLTASGNDPQRKAYPVEFKDIKTDKAISACLRDFDRDPKNARLALNLGRAYNKKGNYKESIKWVSLAKDMNYPYAFHFYGILHGFGEGVPKDKKAEIEYLKVAASKGVRYSNVRLAYIELDKKIRDIDFAKLDKLIAEAGYFHSDSSLLWAKYDHAKSKKFLSTRMRFDWKETLKMRDSVSKIKLRLNKADLRAYKNLLDNSIAHYEDWLSHEKDKAESKNLSQLKYFRRRFN